MKKPVRAALFWTFLIGFLILAPLLVLYTFGFRYNFQTHQVEHTGIISITTTPRNADILVDGKDHRMTTPTIIKQLRPREHTVTISKEGFHSWEKLITVIEQETVFLDSIVLWSQEEAVLREARGEVHLVNPTKTALVSLEESGAWTEIWIEDLRTSERSLTARFPGSSPQDIGLQWSPDGDRLLLSHGLETILVTNLDGSDQQHITEYIPLGLQRIWWDEGRSDSLVLTTGSQTLRLDITSGETTTLLPFPAQTFLSVGDQMYYTQNVGTQTHVIQSHGEAEEVIALIPRGSYQFISTRMPFLLLFEETRERIVLLDANDHDQPILLNTEAVEAFWSPRENQLLYTNGFETHIFSPETLEDTLIDRVSQPISSLAWHPSGKALLLAHTDGITAYDLHQPGSFVQTILNAAQDISRVFIDEKGEFLYFLGSIDGIYGFYQQPIR